MARVFAIVMMCFVALSLTAGTVVHAAEPIAVCHEADLDLQQGDSLGDSQQGPADNDPSGNDTDNNNDKATAHQHGGCHGHHQLAKPVGDEPGAQRSASAALPAIGTMTALASAGTDPALRPPRA